MEKNTLFNHALKFGFIIGIVSIIIGILAYMAGGVFLGRAYFDLFYPLVIISVLLKVFAQRELEKISQSEQPH